MTIPNIRSLDPGTYQDFWSFNSYPNINSHTGTLKQKKSPPENGWLEDDELSFWGRIASWQLRFAVSFLRVPGILKNHPHGRLGRVDDVIFLIHPRKKLSGGESSEAAVKIMALPTRYLHQNGAPSRKNHAD